MDDSMPLRLTLLRMLVLVMGTVLWAQAAEAQNRRSWIASNGDDGNSCDRSNPCSTLEVALAKTTDGGVISVVDAVVLTNTTINKSVTLDGTGSFAGFSTTSDTGLRIEGNGVNVVIRGLNVNGGPNTVGIQCVTGASLLIEDVTISSSFYGIECSPTVPWKLVLKNVSINATNRGLKLLGTQNVHASLTDTTISNSTGNGIEIVNTAGMMRLVIQHSQIDNNGGTGIQIAPTGTGGANVSIADSSVSNNAVGIRAQSTANVKVAVNRSIVSNNSVGLSALSPAVIRLGSSVVSGNSTGVAGNVKSYGNNQLDGNVTQGTVQPEAPKSVP